MPSKTKPCFIAWPRGKELLLVSVAIERQLYPSSPSNEIKPRFKTLRTQTIHSALPIPAMAYLSQKAPPHPIAPALVAVVAAAVAVANPPAAGGGCCCS
jgi:hypothetical protein